MAEQQFTASLNRSQGRNAWCLIFRHPLRRDAQGRIGLRVRRGLGTSDTFEAERLRDQMNELLSDQEWWTPIAREKAENSYDRCIVSAFYDQLAPIKHDFWALREQIIPLPTPESGYTRVLFIGTTGAGKTTLVRQLLGTTQSERFPSTSAAKTTTCDLEIMFAEGSFRAVVTFLPKDRVQMYVEECIVAAVLAQIENRGSQEVLRKLLEHSEQRFRLSYILGGLLLSPQKKDDFAEDEDDEDEDATIEGIVQDPISAEERQRNAENLQKFLFTIQSLAEIVLKDLEKRPDFPHANVAKEERDAWIQEMIESELYKNDVFQQLVDEIIDAVEERFRLLPQSQLFFDQAGWPSYWTYEESDRKNFLPLVNQFSSNYAPLFGRLLTPLVQGIRVAGPFQPEWREIAPLRLVLMDGEGLGHTPDTATSLPTRVTTRFEDADVILLVDDASQPMQATPSTILKTVETSGHIGKLFICFTHFDEVRGDNLPNTHAKRNHVHSSLDNAIAAIGKETGLRTSVALRNALQDRTFFVSKIQEKLQPNAKGTHAELNKMANAFEVVLNSSVLTEIHPVYDDTYLLLFIQRAVKSFHEAWQGRLGLSSQSSRYPEHWSRIKALARRPAQLNLDEYDTLRPVADLIRELSEQIRSFLDKPQRWHPIDNRLEEMQQAAINTIAREVYSRLHILIRKRLIENRIEDRGDDRVPSWKTAYFRYGRGSTRVRAHDIETIYRVAAPPIDEVEGTEEHEFLVKVIELVREAIKAGGGELC